VNRANCKNKLPLYTAIEKRADNKVRRHITRTVGRKECFVAYCTGFPLTLKLNVLELGKRRAVKNHSKLPRLLRCLTCLA